MNVHHDVSLLLPWYVNGTLNEADMARVQAHVASCEGCRKAVDRNVREARDLQGHDDEARVSALIARRDREFGALRERLPGRRRSAPRGPPRWVPALAALLVVVLVIPASWLARSEPTYYELRTNAAIEDSPVLQLVFREGTSHEDIDLLIRTSGRQLGAPTASGIYRIALTAEDPDALLSRIRTHPAVRWAEIEL
jgi:hypothetical protein